MPNQCLQLYTVGLLAATKRREWGGLFLGAVAPITHLVYMCFTVLGDTCPRLVYARQFRMRSNTVNNGFGIFLPKLPHGQPMATPAPRELPESLPRDPREPPDSSQETKILSSQDPKISKSARFQGSRVPSFHGSNQASKIPICQHVKGLQKITDWALAPNK